MFKTTRAQLTLWYVVLLALILIGFSSVLYFTLARALYQQTDDSLAHNAHDLVDGLRIKGDQFDYPGGENDITDLDAVRAQGYLIRILDANGKIRALEEELDALRNVRIAATDRARATQTAVANALNAAADRIEKTTQMLNRTIGGGVAIG